MTIPESPDAIVGEVAGRRAIIVDDIVDTGRRVQMTACFAQMGQLMSLLSQPTRFCLVTLRNVLAGMITSLVLSFTDTLTLPAEKQSAKFTMLSVALVS